MTEQPRPINYIDIDLMEKMCHPLAVAIFDKKEDPIARFDDAEINRLDAALNNSKQSFGGHDLYQTLGKKAAILYYGVNKAHAFRNGNKRIATASLLVFLHINNYWLSGAKKENEDYLVDLALRVASSKGAENKDKLLSELEAWLDKRLVKTGDGFE